MNEAQTTAMGSNWAETKGEAVSNRVTYMKVNKGRNQVRVVGNILRRYVYWVTNVDGSKLTFENLDFNRESEAFENTNMNPVKELKLQATTFTGELEFDKEGNPKPLGSKKAYMVPVINRSTNAVEYMELKKGVFDGINEVMAKLHDPKITRRYADKEYSVPNPSFIDIVFAKNGAGLNTEYKVDIMETMDFVTDPEMFESLSEQHKQDASLIENLKPIEEVFPRKTYTELKEDLTKFMLGKAGNKDKEEGAAGNAPTPSEFKNYDKEAMSELDD